MTLPAEMNAQIESFCSTQIKTLIGIYLSSFGGRWTPEFDKLFLSAARSSIDLIEATYRRDPSFQVADDLSNLTNDGFLEGTEELGEAIRTAAANQFVTFRFSYRSLP
jgi:hypothetical protein